MRSKIILKKEQGTRSKEQEVIGKRKGSSFYEQSTKSYQLPGSKFQVQSSLSILKTIYSVVFIVFLTVTSALAIDPVTVTVSLAPPYTPHLNEYVSAGQGKLQVIITCNDSRMINYPVKLQMFIENMHSGIIMRTGEYAAVPPVFVNGNSTEIYFGADLASYFKPENLVFSGMDRSQYIKTGRIPDGMYRIGFRVVDARRTDVVLSNLGFSAPGWFLLNDPPITNLPRNNAVERINDPQYVKMEWFPRHLGSLNSAFPTQYKIELFPMRIPGMNPNHIVMGMQPEFYDFVSTTSYYLSFNNYMLEPGVQYAWRVQAVSDDGITLFQNNGYSEVQVFSYGDPCPVPQNITATIAGAEAVTVAWDTDQRHTNYELQFRLKDGANHVWNKSESYINNIDINNLLTAGKQYECQVKAGCNTHESGYSDLFTFELPESLLSTFQCGLIDEDTSITNKAPKLDLWPDEVIYNGQFPVRLVEVRGGNGTFSGIGRLAVPFLANIQVLVEFKDITVNEMYQVVRGEMRSIYNPDSKFLINPIDYFTAGNDVGWAKTGLDSAAIWLNHKVDKPSDIAVSYSGNTVIVKVTGSGTTTAVLPTTKGGTTIADSEGNLYAVDEKGNVSKVGKSVNAQSPDGLPAPNFNTNHAGIENLVIFEHDAGDLWAFDSRKKEYSVSSLFDNKYEYINGQYVPWKLIPAGKSGKVIARLSGDIEPGKVVFRTPTGTVYDSKYANGLFKLTVVGGKAGDAQEVYAVYQESDSTTRTLGKLSVATYPWLKRKVVLVPVTATVDEAAARKSLNDIYNPYGIEWEVTVAEKFEDKSWDLNGDNQLETKSSNFVSVYSAEMKALNSSYKSAKGVDNGSVYIFYFNEGDANVPGLAGDMPVGYQFGYVFTKGETAGTINKTLAHELGHGAFQLDHTFKSGIAQESTHNLMDYASGTELVKYQWDAIFDPQKRVLKFMQGDEDGEYIQIVQCLTGAAIDFALYYSVTWVSMFFDDDIQDVPNFTDFSEVTGYKEFSWKEAGVSASISCATSVIPAFSSKENIRKLAVGIAAFAGAAEGMATELAKQYDITCEQLKAEGKSTGVSEILTQLNWSNVLANAGINSAVSAFSTFVATSPKYQKLLTTIKTKLNVSSQNYSQELLSYINKRLDNRIAKGAGKLDLGKFVKKIGDYEVFEGGEVFYRTMSKEHYEALLNTKKLSATSETFTSPTQLYSEAYEGYLVKISVKHGTLDKLKLVGTSDGTADVVKKFGEMPKNSKGWTSSNAYFKKEGAQVNIGLGKGNALELFNENINGFELIKIIE